MPNMAMELNKNVLLVTAEWLHADVNESSFIITIICFKQRPSRRSVASIFHKMNSLEVVQVVNKDDWWIDDDDDDDYTFLWGINPLNAKDVLYTSHKKYNYNNTPVLYDMITINSWLLG